MALSARVQRVNGTDWSARFCHCSHLWTKVTGGARAPLHLISIPVQEPIMANGKNTLLASGAFALLLSFGTIVVAAGLTSQVIGAAASFGTPIDWAIDMAVQQRVATERLSANDQRIAREQLQMKFQSLSAPDQQKAIAATQMVTSEIGLARAMLIIESLVHDSARAIARGQRSQPLTQGGGPGAQSKLGIGGRDLIFVATAGPCRVFDSRFGAGPLAGGASRQIWTWSTGGYNFASDGQGGTGTAGVGNCVGTEFPTQPPTSVVATVTVVNTSSPGSMRAWDGGATLTVGSVLAWNAGDRLANTTIIPVDRTIAEYPGSGPKRDFGVNNNSATAIDIVVDVIGYFIVNTGTALDCTTVVDFSGKVIAPGEVAAIPTQSCPTGFTRVSNQPITGVPGVYVVGVTDSFCAMGNLSSGFRNAFCDVRCCRLPGQ